MEVTMRNELASVELKALTSNTETGIEWSESDEKTVLVISASTETDLTVKAGNGIQGMTDLTLTVHKGTSLLKLDSGAYKNVSGDNKGKIVISSTGTPSVGIAALV